MAKRTISFKVVERARSAGARSFRDEPVWVGYWSFPLLDPMGNTVEVTCTVKDLQVASLERP